MYFFLNAASHVSVSWTKTKEISADIADCENALKPE